MNTPWSVDVDGFHIVDKDCNDVCECSTREQAEYIVKTVNIAADRSS